jgi:hypothetical protein
MSDGQSPRPGGDEEFGRAPDPDETFGTAPAARSRVPLLVGGLVALVVVVAAVVGFVVR